MDYTKLEEAYNETFGGLTMYYRDCELNPDFISKYKKNQILLERGFTDVSSLAEGLGTNLRYAIASNKAVNMAQINPDVAKYRFHLISASAYYKVLDVYTVGDKTQILLLHFDQKFMSIFSTAISNIEENVIAKGRKSLETKLQIPPNNFLYENEWLQRTQFPIGMSDTGKFFPLSAPKVVQKDTNPTTNTTTQTASTVKSEEPKKSFWKKLFEK
ncbi:MAG: hypothetical protein AAF611_01340 [Bacteroidota bacterium]